MSSYLPSFEFTPSIREAVRAGTLQLQTGQWVSLCGAVGRVVMRPSHCGAVVWRRRNESFSRFQARFSAICRDRFKLLSLSDLPRGIKVPASARRCRFRPVPSPRLPSIEPFFRIRARGDDRTLPLPFDSSADLDSFLPAFRASVPSWPVYQGASHGFLH